MAARITAEAAIAGAILLSLTLVLFSATVYADVVNPLNGGSANIRDVLPLTQDGFIKECRSHDVGTGQVNGSDATNGLGTILDNDSTSPLDITLSISNIPLVNEEAILLCTVASTIDAPDTKVKVYLPAHVNLISGTTEGKWDLTKDKPITFTAVIKFTKANDYQIIGKASAKQEKGHKWAAEDALFLTIGTEQSGPTPPPKFIESAVPMGVVQPPSSFTSVEAQNKRVSGLIPPPISEGEQLPEVSADGTVTVTGNFYYLTNVVDGQINDYRDSEGTLVPLQTALVEIFNVNTSEHLGWAYTNTDGSFSTSITNPYPDSIGYVVYAYMKYNFAQSYETRVIYQGSTLTGLIDVWAFGSGVGQIPSGATTYDIGGWMPYSGSDTLHAFWLYQDLVKVWHYMPHEYMGSSTIRWYATQTPSDGAWYEGGSVIFLGGLVFKSADTTIHEFGHNYMYNVHGMWYNDCPNPHYFEASSGPNCGYTEGWANFLAFAVNGNAVYNWSSGAWLDLEEPTWGTWGWDNGDYCEGRVVGAMYDMLDTNDDDYDVYSYPFSYMDAVMWSNTGWDFPSYWNTWIASGYPSKADFCLYQNTIDYGFNDISVTIPNSMTTWMAGNTHSIQWNYIGNPGSTVEIYLQRPGNTDLLINSSTSTGSGGQGSYSWTIPGDSNPESGYSVKVASTSNPAINGTSEEFTISAPATDTIPPASVTNLQNVTYAKTFINWTWTDPTDADFDRVMVYLDEAFITNVSKGVQFYNATGLLSNTSHTLATHTVDANGNVNGTWVNSTALTAPDVVPLPGYTKVPTDPDNDGRYEDLTGNGVFTYVDITVFYNYYNWVKDNEPVSAFDFSGNGAITYVDVTVLYNHPRSG